MFRQEALDTHKSRWLGKAILLRGIPSWLISAACFLFLIILLIFLITGSYTRRISVSGEVTTLPRAANVYSSTQGFVVKQYAVAGQRVKKGDPIYGIDSNRSTSNGIVSVNQRRDIESQLERVNSIIGRIKENKQVSLNALVSQKTQYVDALKTSSEIMAEAEKGISILKNNMESYKRYQQKGLINKDQFINQVAVYYQQQNNLLTLSAQNKQNILQINDIESRIQTESAEFDNKIYQMELQKFELQKELINSDANGAVIVRAVTDGVIDSMSVTEGQMVNTGDSLFQTIPVNAKNYYLVLWVPNNAIPYISPGLAVNIRYEAFPAEKFGQFAGKIIAVSNTPAAPQEMQTYLGAPKSAQSESIPYYKVIVQPVKQGVDYNHKHLALENGMKADSTFFLEKRKIYQWMIAPFYDMKISAAGQVKDEK